LPEPSPAIPDLPLPAGEPVRLSILIVNYNGGTQLRDCLSSVYETVKTAPMEVIVVDNASSDDSVREAAGAFPQVKFIENDENRWFTGGSNQAAAACSGEYMLFLNPDTVCHEDAVDALVRFLDDNPRAGIVGPRLLNGDGTLQPSCRKFLKSRYLVLKHLLPWSVLPDSWKRRMILEYWSHDETVEVDWLVGACLLARRKAVAEVGLKDEGFPMFHEETDWCYRMKEKGWSTWFLHTARITHFGSQSTSKRWGDRLILEFYRGKHRFIRKHFGPAALFVHRVLLAGLLGARLVAVTARRLLEDDEALRSEISFLLGGIAIQLGLGGDDRGED